MVGPGRIIGDIDAQKFEGLHHLHISTIDAGCGIHTTSFPDVWVHGLILTAPVRSLNGQRQCIHTTEWCHGQQLFYICQWIWTLVRSQSFLGKNDVFPFCLHSVVDYQGIFGNHQCSLTSFCSHLRIKSVFTMHMDTMQFQFKDVQAVLKHIWTWSQREVWLLLTANLQDYNQQHSLNPQYHGRAKCVVPPCIFQPVVLYHFICSVHLLILCVCDFYLMFIKMENKYSWMWLKLRSIVMFGFGYWCIGQSSL